MDGNGYCPFNSAFVCLWTTGRFDFQNGEDLFIRFINYCYSNEQRLTPQHVEIQIETFEGWIDSQIHPHVNTLRQTMFLVLAEFLQVNIMLLSNIPHFCALYRPGDVNIQTTVAIYHCDTGEGGRFVPLIPT